MENEILIEIPMLSVPFSSNSKFECGYFDNKTNKFVTDGVSLDETKTISTSVSCKTKHLTSFAVREYP